MRFPATTEHKTSIRTVTNASPPEQKMVISISASPKALVEPLIEPLTQQLFCKREFIPLGADVLWRIDRGVVRTSTWNQEKQLNALGYWGPGDIVGHSLSRVKPYQIECLTSVEMSILPSELWSQALDAMLSHIQQTEELLTILHQKPVSRRLWDFLIWLGQKFGRDVDTGRLIDLQLTHQELASALGTTRVSVTRMLQEFESEGMLLRHQRQFILRPANINVSFQLQALLQVNPGKVAQAVAS